MTKPISRKMAVDCLLHQGGVGFIYCGICGSALFPNDNIQFDHIHAIVHDGPHEYQNIRPVHAECHKIKTKADIQANAKIKRLINPRPSKRPMKSGKQKIPSRPFQKRVK